MLGFLDGDRRRSLIARAHGDGLIDYSKFDSYNGLDLLREQLLLNSLFAREESEVIKLGWQRKLMFALSAVLTGSDNRGKVLGELDELFRYFLWRLSPWDKTLAASTMEGRNPEALKEAWEAEFGRLDDPETQRKLKAYDDMLAKMTGKKG